MSQLAWFGNTVSKQTPVGNQSRRHGGFNGGLRPQNSYKSHKIEIWNAINQNQRIFCQILEYQSPHTHKRSLPIEDFLVMILLVTNKGKK